MMLSHEDGFLYFKLHWNLMFFVNQRLKVIPHDVSCPEEFAVLPAEVRIKVRDALLENIDLLQAFADENPAGLNAEELDIVLSWRHFVAGKFWIFRKLKNYTIFLKGGDDLIPYGVVALSRPLDELIGPVLPVMAHAVLLPFKDKIVYDGILLADRIFFGGGVKRMLNDTYKNAKSNYGIVTSLPMTDAQRMPAKRP